MRSLGRQFEEQGAAAQLRSPWRTRSPQAREDPADLIHTLLPFEPQAVAPHRHSAGRPCSPTRPVNPRHVDRRRRSPAPSSDYFTTGRRHRSGRPRQREAPSGWTPADRSEAASPQVENRCDRHIRPRRHSATIGDLDPHPLRSKDPSRQAIPLRARGSTSASRRPNAFEPLEIDVGERKVRTGDGPGSSTPRHDRTGREVPSSARRSPGTLSPCSYGQMGRAHRPGGTGATD